MDTEDKVAKIEELIVAKGYKSTRTRRILIKIFVENKEHLKPEQIFMITRNQGISLPTIYRNIDILKKIGVIKEVIFHNERYYELDMYSQKKLHIHFQCNKCGQIKEYLNNHIFRAMIEQRDYIEKVFDDDIHDIMIVMSGTCSSCKKDQHIGIETEMKP